MAKGDNVERFAYIYEVATDPLDKGIKHAKDTITTFTGTVTQGLGNVLDKITQTVSGFSMFAGAKAKGAMKLFGGMVGRVQKGSRGLFQMENRLGGIASTLKFIAKVGGFAVILGPLLPLIKPFMKLVSVVTDTLNPALEVITQSLKAAFAPLAVTFHRLAIKILPHLMRVIQPIASFLVKLVEGFGELFEGDALADFVSIFDELVPIIKDIATSFVRDFLKPVGGVLFRTVIKMFKSLVNFAVMFVKTIKPYLPDFFKFLNKIATLVITVIGDSFDTLLLGLSDIIKDPKFMELLKSLTELLTALVGPMTKLLPPLMNIFTKVLVLLMKILTPVALRVLEKMIQGLVFWLERLEEEMPAIEKFLNRIVKWFEENEDLAGKVVKGIVSGIKEVVKFAKGAIKWIGELIDDTVEALRILGLVKEPEAVRKQREKEGAAEVTFRQQQASPGIVSAMWDKNIARALEQGRKAGWDEVKLMNMRQAMEGRKYTAVTAAKIRMAQMEGKARGGFVQHRQVVEVAEVHPEWIVPNTPEAMLHYIPQMLRSVMKGGGATPTGAAVTAVTSDMLLRTIAETLRSMEQILRDIQESGDETLPEVIT